MLACAEQKRAVEAIAELLGLSPLLVSHHLRLLRAARIVRAERQGKQVFYVAADRHISAMLGELLEHKAEPQSDPADID
ncbi:Transcriptional regulator, ArsR family [Candidatus Paraburkholderia kirkii UZHbot1]|uniref:Transcriptional regulator, ArsR family n=1 Tax=Candidatus Paraburkholderia kirkii UZHbot1 TaxID=1055526 RepID=G4MH11_9BURK|nr:Transcriptional regulator, ArsR family [Candidatus Paraburkholderia kirkii UZHbot1]